MTRPEQSRPLPLRDADGGATFGEAWQAEVLALADTLIANGTFSAPEWSDQLGRNLKQSEIEGAPDNQDTYYTAALQALESLVAEKSEISGDHLAERREAWEKAYRSTPHGKPVELASHAITGQSTPE